MIIFTNFIPISMQVSLEMCKFFQAINMSKDELMKTRIFEADGEKYEDVYCVVNSSNLNEELGSVDYIFSDKTGTLTCNIMDFKNVVVNGISYGEEEGGRKGVDPNSTLINYDNVDFTDPKFQADLNFTSTDRYSNKTK